MLRATDKNLNFFGPLFNFNRVVRSYKQDGMICFDLTSDSSNPLAIGYIIQRLLSYGDQNFCEVAQGLQQVGLHNANVYSEQ